MWRFHTWRDDEGDCCAHAIPNHQEERTLSMARYSRQDIDALSKRLEVRASVLPAEHGRELMAAALLLRLMLALADVQVVET
jgi:hypothetical protein